MHNNPKPQQPERTKENMFDWLVEACQKDWAKKNGQ